MIPSKFLFFSLHFFKQILHFLFKGLYHLHNVIFKVILFSFICTGMFRCCRTTVFRQCHVVEYFLILPSTYFFFFSVLEEHVPPGVSLPPTGADGAFDSRGG